MLGLSILFIEEVLVVNYAKIKECDISNGLGVRVSLFVSGCRRHCKGCFNPETWNFEYGEEFTFETMKYILELLDRSYIAGLSILGGEPLEPENVEAVTSLCAWVKQMTDKTIWLYTGKRYEEVKDLNIMNFLDVLVDGAFEEGLKDPGLPFRGSINQRILNIKELRGE